MRDDDRNRQCEQFRLTSFPLGSSISYDHFVAFHHPLGSSGIVTWLGTYRRRLFRAVLVCLLLFVGVRLAYARDACVPLPGQAVVNIPGLSGSVSPCSVPAGRWLPAPLHWLLTREIVWYQSGGDYYFDISSCTTREFFSDTTTVSSSLNAPVRLTVWQRPGRSYSCLNP